MLLMGLGGILLAAALHSLLGVSTWIWSPISALIRIFSALAIVALGVFGSITAQNAYRDGWASIFIFGMFFAALSLLLLIRFYRTRPGKSDISRPNDVLSRSVPAMDAWSQLLTQMGWAQRRQCNDSRAKIDAFLAEEDSGSLSADHHQLLVTLRQRLPQLTEECLRRCKSATSAERNEYLQRLCKTLSDLAESAEKARREIRLADDRHLDVLHGYFASVSKKNSQPLIP